MPEKIRVAMLGAGLMARSHMEAIAKLGDRAELVAVADVNAEARQRAAAEFGIEEQYEDALAAAREAAADAVIVCIPNHLHAPATLAALENGKHVLVEKPMALSRADAGAMVAAAEHAGRVLMCGLSLRFMSPIRQVKALVAKGATGGLFFTVDDCRATYQELKGRGPDELGGVHVGAAVTATSAAV